MTHSSEVSDRIRKRRLYLGVQETAPRTARIHTSAVLAAWRMPDLSGDAEAIVTELVTNAVQAAHRATGERSGQGRAMITYTMHAAYGTLLMSVADPFPGLPELRAGGIADESGRGLMLVDALSAEWGCRQRSGGKVVWAKLSREAG